MSVDIFGVVDPGDWEAGVDARFTEHRANWATGNAVMIAEYLGLPPIDPCDHCGEWDARDVKARCVTARAVGGNLSDDGMPGAEDGGPGTGQARWIDPGLRPGYFADKVAELERVADECIELSLDDISYA